MTTTGNFKWQWISKKTQVRVAVIVYACNSCLTIWWVLFFSKSPELSALSLSWRIALPDKSLTSFCWPEL